MTRQRFGRRSFMKGSAAAAAGLAAGGIFKPAIVRAQTTEIVHWSWLAASDAEVWQKCIDNFNAAHTDVQIRMEIVPEEQYRTKVLTAAATGSAPDFGWGTAGKGAALAKNGVVIAIDDLAREVGFDVSDFSASSLAASKYPKYGDGLYMVPMDLMSLQPLMNLDHVAAAGLDPTKPPTDEASLLDWATKLTKTDGDRITQSGILMTGTGLQPCVTWGIIAAQMGFHRASDDLTTACVNPDAGKAAMQWVLDLFDKHKVSTRDITDRYKAFGTGEGSIFWTGPWTLNGYKSQGLNFASFLFPQIGASRQTYFEMGGLELYKQADEGRHKATMDAVKWLSDNSFLWTTEGRGVTPRPSILNRADYKTAGLPWDLRGAFVDGLSFATVGEVPVPAGPDFTIYTNTDFLARTLEGVWVGEKTIDDAMEEIRVQWQQDLDDA